VSKDTSVPSKKTVLAAGAVLWRTGRQGVEVAVIHRPRYDDWSLPKGKVDPGETEPATAVRSGSGTGRHGRSTGSSRPTTRSTNCCGCRSPRR
jgi:8-oxo-dGTP diphosphatase